MPISEGQHQCELMLALIYPNYQTGWDAFNDYSNTDLLKNAGEYVISDCIPVYQNGVLISGREPDGKTPDVTTEPQKPETLPGDVNADSKVNSADLVLLIQYLLGNKSLSKTGRRQRRPLRRQDGKRTGCGGAAAESDGKLTLPSVRI